MQMQVVWCSLILGILGLAISCDSGNPPGNADRSTPLAGSKEKAEAPGKTENVSKENGESTVTDSNDSLLPIMTISTDKGKIVLELFEDDAPNTVANFIELSEKGFYNGLTFHRVIDNFMIQGGCPLGTGTGGPGYRFEDEISSRRHDGAGILSMANSGSNSNGSQFFITHVATPHLDGKHTVFGRVTEGQDVVDAIRKGDTIKSFEVTRKRNHTYKVKTF